MGIISTTPIMIGVGRSARPTELQVRGGGVSTLPAFTIFDVRNVSQVVGSIFTLDSGPIFEQTVDFLTNGQTSTNPYDSLIIFDLGPGAIYGEKKRFFNGGYPGVDLRGLTIEGLDLSVDSFRSIEDFDEAHITFVIRGEFPLWWRALRHRFAVFVLGSLIGGLLLWLVLVLLGASGIHLRF
jgi:hypothetical protein